MVQYAPCYSRIIDAKALAIKPVLSKLIGSVGSHLICELGMRKGVFGLVGSLGRNSFDNGACYIRALQTKDKGFTVCVM